MVPAQIGRLVGGLVVAALLVGCSSSPDAPPPPEPAPRTTTPAPAETPDLPDVGSYVAMGDSFTAGPGLEELRSDAGFCLRSTRNWPSLLERMLDAERFRDVSCVGASTSELLDSGSRITAAPPQVDAVDAGTDLVTVGIGGNDGNLFASLISACTGGHGACGSFARDQAPAILDQTIPRITATLDAIRDRAPDATILLVGYPRIMPETGTCEAIGIPDGDAAAVVEAEQSLDDALSTAARQAEVGYVSMRQASRGHDACAGADAWTNGDTVQDGDGIAFHPRLAGMKAIARAVAGELAKS